MINKKPKSHIFRLGFNVKKDPRSEKEQTLYIWHSYGSSKTKRSVSKLPMNHWDFSDKRGHIKHHLRGLKQYEETVKFIDNFHLESSNIAHKLRNNEVKLDDAFKILQRTHTTGNVLKSFETNCNDHKDYKGKSSAIRKYYSAIITVTNHLERNNFFKGKYRNIIQLDEFGEEKTIKYQIKELDYEHLQNLTDRKKIETIIGGLTIKNSTKNDYLEALNLVCKVNPKISLIPFDLLIESMDEKSVRREAIKRRDLQIGVSKIGDNYQWLEAYLYFLFSFCLRGLNGSDICMLNEDWIETASGSKDLDYLHYHPDYDKIIKTEKKFTEKIYIVGKRSKTQNKGSEIKILLNQYPTLVIHRLLKRCIYFNRPNLAYNGKDKFRLYNIDYRTAAGQQKWKDLQNTYSKQLKKVTGGTCGQARHTFCKYLKILGIDKKHFSVSLGHIIRKDSVDFYVAEKSQIELDIIHTEVLKKININHIVKLILKVTKDKKLPAREIFKGAYIETVGKPQLKRKTVNSFLGKMNKEMEWCPSSKLELEALNIPLSSWDYTKEIELQTMLLDENDNVNIDIDKNGDVIINETENYSAELKLLLKQKQVVLKKEFDKRESKGQSFDEFIKNITIADNKKIKA